MKKMLAMFLSMLMIATGLSGCGGGTANTPVVSDETQLITDTESISYGYDKVYKNSELNDSVNGFTSSSEITGARFLINGKYSSSFTSFNSRSDVKLEFYNGKSARMVNVSGGMAYTLPTTEKLSVDYSIAKYRTQIVLGDSVLTVSTESSNPYAATSDPWGIYRDEWLLRWINNDEYITENGLERVQDVVYADTTMREGYEIYMYSIKIGDEENKIERPYYNIGIIRESSDNINFGLFVMKSKTDRTGDMKDILMSYAKLTPKGIQKNYYDAGTPVENANWSNETRAYYRQLMADDSVNWGAFSYSMPGTSDSLVAGSGTYDEYYAKSVAMQQGIETQAWNHKFEIYPTYTHIGWYSSMHYFPTSMAEELAGGDGKNGKPVLQFTYQFTTDNNTVSTNGTPMFDILRGKYDEHFKKLAQDIKAYGKPVLFRLNNEMNTDWTSYCGMITLLDPDIFQMTWRYLYNIFEEEGVDNCIWIWNPIALSCPYSSWGEDLCYNPGAEYVQLLGLTDYVMNNGTDGKEIESFESKYSALYEKNSAWTQYRSIISEFACGSGGNVSGTLGRNAALQAKWVKEMFECLNAATKQDFAKQLVGAVWFNCNDGDGNTLSNRLRFYEPDSTVYSDLSETIKAFKEGFNPVK